jgi:hypothetical protein
MPVAHRIASLPLRGTPRVVLPVRIAFTHMTVAGFKKKWTRYGGKETSAYQEHFNDLCGILGQKTPAEADPSGNDWFCPKARRQGS